MKKQQKVLNKHVDLKLYTNQHKKLEFWIIQAMDEYAKLYHENKIKNLSLSGVIKSVCLEGNTPTECKQFLALGNCEKCNHFNKQTVL